MLGVRCTYVSGLSLNATVSCEAREHIIYQRSARSESCVVPLLEGEHDFVKNVDYVTVVDYKIIS